MYTEGQERKKPFPPPAVMSCTRRGQQVHMVQLHGGLRARVHEVVEPSHQLFVHVVETERVPRATLAAGFEADRVLDIPVLFRVRRDPVPAWAWGRRADKTCLGYGP